MAVETFPISEGDNEIEVLQLVLEQEKLSPDRRSVDSIAMGEPQSGQVIVV